MSRRPGSKVRFAAAEDLAPEPDPVPRIGPVVFSLPFDGREVTFDLSDLPCPRLVRVLARGLCEIGGDDGARRTVTGFSLFVAAVRDFAAFTGAAETSRAERFDLEDLEPELLDAFEDKLVTDHGRAGSRPPDEMAALVRLLRLAADANPGAMDAAMLTRITYGMATPTEYAKKPLDAYPLPLFEEIKEAALSDVRVIRDRILAGEKRAAAGQDPEIGGWDHLDNVLWYVARHGPIKPGDPIWKRLRYRWPGGVRAINEHLFLNRDDTLAFLVALICLTGLEPECAKGLRADCLVSPARGYVSVGYVKRRAGADAAKALRVADGGALHHPGGLLRLALRLTQRGRTMLGGECLWVETGIGGSLREPFKFATDQGFSWQVPRFLDRHGLAGRPDRGGGPIRFDLRRLRKSFKSEQYHRAAGILPDFAVGHSPQTAAAHYADIDAHRELHDTAIEDGLREALEVALPAPVVVDDDGKRLDDGDQRLTDGEVEKVLSGQADVWLASCRGFYESPFARRKGEGCPVAIWGCLECPNAVFSTRTLPGVLSFLAFCQDQRDELSPQEWTARYERSWQRIVHGIRPRFTDEQLRTALAIAEGAGPILSLPAQILEHSR
jgi:hypothetical protein